MSKRRKIKESELKFDKLLEKRSLLCVKPRL